MQVKLDHPKFSLKPPFVKFGTFKTIFDPPAPGITSFNVSVYVDPAFAMFDPTNSGPLGIFSVGGDSPPVNPGIGTQSVELDLGTGFNPGSPLPGSTLTYTDVAGLITVNYQLASPITTTGDVNIFALDFVFAHPQIVNLATSSVTYLASGPGGALTQVSSGCAPNSCGSDHPASGVTFNGFASEVPEPATWVMMMVGFAGIGLPLRRWSRMQPRTA
jgi:hypothetical protein